MLPADAPLRQRVFWASMAVIVGVVHDANAHGEDYATERLFQRIVAAGRSFGLSEWEVDHRLAKRFGFYYHRPTDCYVDRATYEMLMEGDVGLRRYVH